MLDRSDIRLRAAQLRSNFEEAGALVVDPPLLQPAGLLLDLYGEDIRARAYVTSDGLRGEQMLRPDFTVPVVQMHMREGAEPARYTYAGEVFRRQEHDPDRANEYVQVGYEIFDRDNPAAADARGVCPDGQECRRVGSAGCNWRYWHSDGGCCGAEHNGAPQGGFDASHLAATAVPGIAGSLCHRVAVPRRLGPVVTDGVYPGRCRNCEAARHIAMF